MQLYGHLLYGVCSQSIYLPKAPEFKDTVSIATGFTVTVCLPRTAFLAGSL